MKSLSILFLALFSFSVFSQDYLNCDFKINDNKIKKDAKILSESTFKLSLELYPGIDHSQEISIDRIIAYPGEAKTDKYLIRVFKDDDRNKDLNIPTSRLEKSDSIQLSIFDNGVSTVATFKTKVATYNLTFGGQGLSSSHTFYLYSKFNYLKEDRVYSKLSPFIVSCQRVPKEIVVESELRKEIQREKEIHEQARKQSKLK